MFTLPPRPPKDYYIDDVTPSLTSSSQFTATERPRVTQRNLGKYCVPVEYADDELPEKVPTKLHTKILEKMMLDERYSWVTSPGKQDYFVHDMFKKFTIDRAKGIYDPRYMHKEKIFNRSYQFELDCIEASRLEKLRVKNEQEDAEFEGAFQRIVKKQKEKETPPIPLIPCKAQPPMWWPPAPEPEEQTVETINVLPVDMRSSARWIQEPNLTAFVQDNPCQRKKDLLLRYESKCPKDSNVKSGKSCLFSLSPDQAEEAMNKLDIFVTVYKKMPPGWMPATVDIGSALISIANLFEELINSITASTGEEGSTPTAKTLKDDFDISASSGELCGKIGVYIRMSCFGKLIVTQFQMNLQDKSVLFKDREGKSLYRYKKAGKGGSKNGVCTPKSIMSKQGKKGSGSKSAGDGSCICNAPPPSLSTNGGAGGFPEAANICVETCPFNPCLKYDQSGAPGVNSGAGGGIITDYPGGIGYNGGGMPGSGGMPGMSHGGKRLLGQGPNCRPPTMGFNAGGGPGMGFNAGMAPGMGFNGGNPGMGFNGGNPGMGFNGGGAPGMGFNGAGGPGISFNGGGGPGMGGGAPCFECDKQPNPPCAMPVNGINGGYGADFGGGGFGRGFGGGVFGGGFGNGFNPKPPGSPNSDLPCSECFPCPYAEEGDSCTCPKSNGGPEGNYQEIGATMGGNSLTIRVHKDKGNVEALDENTTESCVCANTRNNMNVNMQPGVQQAGQNFPFAFRMGQQGQPSGNNANVVVNPPTSTSPNGAKVAEFSDPNKELFVLRIGKKSEGVDKKQNLELELCTPKGPERKPIPQKVSIDTQYDPKDAGPGKGKKGKGKGKKGKGKKGKEKGKGKKKK